MSFILDALKKSETERQQTGNTEFAAVPTSPTRQSFPRWLLVVGILLAVNLIVLIGLLLRSDDNVGVSTSPAPTPAATEAPDNTFEEQVATARQNRPRNVPQEVVATQSAPEPTPTLQADLISQHPETVPASDLYPTIQEVRVSNTIALPELHLDIHVYSEEPADRFVFINMSKLREGSQLAEGPVVVEIRPDGVVLRHSGTLFLVPRE